MKDLFAGMREMGHELVVFRSEPEAGYRGIIAVHSTVLGPSLGGTRFWNYATEEEAIADALRLSKAMTYKAAVAGLDLGGGKSVVIGDPRITGEARERIFRAHGRAIESLGGRYWAAEDVGTGEDDMEAIRAETRFVTGRRSGSGDPSPLTALGTFEGIRACARERWGDPSLEGKRVAVQGLGHVGGHLCALLAGAGARLVVSDVDPARVRAMVERHGATAVAPDEILEVEADILAPCALGAVLRDETIPRLRVEIVAGAANNQLAEPRHGDELERRGILYAPDYVINAGGLISVCGEIAGWDAEESRRRATAIHDTLLEVFRRARSEGITTARAADRMAEARLARGR